MQSASSRYTNLGALIGGVYTLHVVRKHRQIVVRELEDGQVCHVKKHVKIHDTVQLVVKNTKTFKVL